MSIKRLECTTLDKIIVYNFIKDCDFCTGAAVRREKRFLLQDQPTFTTQPYAIPQHTIYPWPTQRHTYPSPPTITHTHSSRAGHVVATSTTNAPGVSSGQTSLIPINVLLNATQVNCPVKRDTRVVRMFMDDEVMRRMYLELVGQYDTAVVAATRDEAAHNFRHLINRKHLQVKFITL